MYLLTFSLLYFAHFPRTHSNRKLHFDLSQCIYKVMVLINLPPAVHSLREFVVTCTVTYTTHIKYESSCCWCPSYWPQHKKYNFYFNQPNGSVRRKFQTPPYHHHYRISHFYRSNKKNTCKWLLVNTVFNYSSAFKAPSINFHLLAWKRHLVDHGLIRTLFRYSLTAHVCVFFLYMYIRVVYIQISIYMVLSDVRDGLMMYHVWTNIKHTFS